MGQTAVCRGISSPTIALDSTSAARHTRVESAVLSDAAGPRSGHVSGTVQPSKWYDTVRNSGPAARAAAAAASASCSSTLSFLRDACV